MSQRKPFIAGNWKMNGLAAEGRDLALAITHWYASNGKGKAEIVLCPPFTFLSEAARLVHGTAVGIGAQDCHAEAAGAHTGDISAPMLKDAGCRYVILGHSERRADHGETDQLIAAKGIAAHKSGLVAIICVGETLDQRQSNQTFSVIKAQILASVPKSCTAHDTVIAYEPVWAIGTGKVATPAQAQEVHAFIRSTLADHLGGAVSTSMRILYGGSMKPDNAEELLALDDVDGGLIGGAALKAEDFTTLISLSETKA
jgi:triosephosphate isomerase